MSLFQSTVVSKYLQTQNKEVNSPGKEMLNFYLARE